MNYWDKDILKEQYLSPDYLFRFQCNPIDWTALPIEDYEMVICGNGKLVCLRRKVDFDDVLQVSFYVSEANKVLIPMNASSCQNSSSFICHKAVMN